MTDPVESMLTPADVAAYLRISERQLRRLRSTGEGPPFHRIGRRIVYKRAEVETWVNLDGGQ